MFVQSQRIPWRATGASLARIGTRAKLLSHDTATGAATMLIEYPAGWRQPGSMALAAMEEFYVLRGSLQIGEQPYRDHSYGSLTCFMMLIRSCGGPLVNVIPDERVAVDFAAPYRPVLPPELTPYAGEWEAEANA